MYVRPNQTNLLSAISLPLLLIGCFDSFRSVNSSHVQENSPHTDTDSVQAATEPDGGVELSKSPSEREEGRLEDPDALRALIVAKTAEADANPNETAGSSTAPTPSTTGVPPAADNLALSSKKCLNALKKQDVPFERPGFQTPLIETPVLLSGPIGGVRIGPHYIGNSKPTNAVMDCHLALALVEVAAHAESLGISAIEFYSTYRPLSPPPKKCPKGKGHKKCLKKKKQYARIVREQKSQHRFGRAIDIRWFKTADGRTIDVLEHFDRRPHEPPCSYVPASPEARLLSDFVCGVYRHRVFNVMLTPNANKAHHNHFHFDLTPKASWYIIR